MRHRMSFMLGVVMVVLALLLAACDTGPSTTLTIVSGSENSTLEPLIQQWAQENNTTVDITYLGSLDIGRMLRTGSITYDAVWPANRLWLDYGDVNNLVGSEQSIMRSPVVFGIKRSVAEELGWIDRDVFMEDILNAAEAGELRFMMTSATQSNSGASFYFGALNAFADSPDVLTSDDLESEEVQDKITRILGQVNRSSGSSGWLKDLFLEQYNRYDAMVNYEAVIIEANQELAAQGREPLYVVYPVDGLAIADSPLGFIDRGDEAKADAFARLQEYLLSEPVQQQLLAAGRRATLLGLNPDDASRAVFRPEWGIDLDRVIQPIRFPSTQVISEALTLYQTAFRRPSCTAYVLDFSGSMSGQGEADLKNAMLTLLDQELAAQILLQGHPRDISTVLLFNQEVINAAELDEWTVRGNDPEELLDLFIMIETSFAGGDTSIYNSTRLALQHLDEIRTPECLPAVIVMTDGRDNMGGYDQLVSYVRSTENDIPVFGITFGDADRAQLVPIVELTTGRIFDGTANLVEAFRSAKGYN